jgi:hypothetical protein
MLSKRTYQLAQIRVTDKKKIACSCLSSTETLNEKSASCVNKKIWDYGTPVNMYIVSKIELPSQAAHVLPRGEHMPGNLA